MRAAIRKQYETNEKFKIIQCWWKVVLRKA